MKEIDTRATIRPTPEAKGYLDKLKKNDVFDRMIDAYLFAAAYAIQNNLEISKMTLRDRQDLVVLNRVDEDVLLALAAGIHAIRKRNGQDEPSDSKELLEILTQYAEVGITELKQRWEGKVGSQIQSDISNIISSSVGS
ncbi:MAG: hypothetical protein ACFBSE_22200 [Prochloraceae cyanobacterium]